MTWKQFSAVLGAIILFGGATAVIKEYRFWATPDELRLVATTTYGTAIARQTDHLIRVRLLIAECEAENCKAVRLENLRQQEAGILIEIKRLEREESKLR